MGLYYFSVEFVRLQSAVKITKFLVRLNKKFMPSIEIVCIDQHTPTDFSDMSFAVQVSTELKSHRCPSLFQRDFDQLKGVLYHLGNSACKNSEYRGFFFAYELLSKESRGRTRGRFFEIDPKFRSDFHSIVKTLLAASPVKSIFLTTDWQFGPKKKTKGGEIMVDDFWKMHDAHQLKLNASYTVIGAI